MRTATKGLVLLAIMLMTMSADAARATWAEYGYFDEYGGLVGSITYWCEGRPIVEGQVTGDVRYMDGGTCL